MKQALVSLIRIVARAHSQSTVVKAAELRELSRADLRQVSGGSEFSSPKGTW
jgi:hypothetical protein